MTLEERLEKIENQIVKLTARANTRVSWEEKTTATGIVLSPGPTTVQRTGVVVGTTLAPISPGQAAIVFIVKREDTNELAVMDASSVKVLND